jgi:hypothetical protein
MLDFEKTCGLKLIKDLVGEDKNLSRIYGFILYTEKDPYVAKVLRDADFWNALDSISGANWPIFAVRPLSEGQYKMPSSSGKAISYMVPTWDEPRANMPVLHDFGMKDSENLPLFVAFMWDDQDELNQISISITGNDVDSVYHSIEDIVKAITKVENDVEPQYKRTVNVFRNVVTEIKALDFKHKLIQRGKISFRISEFLGTFI